MSKNIAGFKVNKVCCKTCPFSDGGSLQVRQSVQRRCLSVGSQLCHGTGNKTLCRGARDFQLQIFHRLGVLKEPTDKCWRETYETLKKEKI